MQMSRRELLDDFLDFVVESGDVAARDTAERLYNRALMTIWRKHPWRQFWMPQPVQITLQAGVRSYVLPAVFGRVAGGKIRNLTTPCDIVGTEAEIISTLHPEAGTSEEVPGPPQLYYMSGTSGVERILATPDMVTVNSNSAADGESVAWTVEGFMQDGATWRRLTGVLNGTAPVSIFTQPFLPWTFSKAYKAGIVPPTELTSSTGSVVLSTSTLVLQRLFPYETAVEHQVITLYPKPDTTGDILAIPYMRRPVRSLNDGDVVPMDWTEAIFEEMVIQWRVNQGEMNVDSAANAIRPKLLDLLAFETANRGGYPRRTRPFVG